MAVSFDTTVSGEDSTSYATVAEADQYAEDYALTAWSTLSDDDTKKQNLNKAAQYLDQHYFDRWRGTPADVDQALAWPRSGVTRSDGSEMSSETIPRSIKSAQIEAANFFAASVDITADITAAAIREKLENLGEVEYRDYGISSASPIRTRIDQLIKFPLVEAGGNNIKMVLA